MSAARTFATMSSDASGILQLPLDALEGVWDELRAYECDEANEADFDGEFPMANRNAPNVHQHALRCTCKALRDATSAWIHQLDIEVEMRNGHEDRAWVQTMKQMEAAVMYGLNLTCTLNEGKQQDIVAGLMGEGLWTPHSTAQADRDHKRPHGGLGNST